VSFMTAIGAGAHVVNDGDFAVAINADGDCLTIDADGEARWAGAISLKQAAAGAAETLVRELWKPEVSDAARAVALTRLYDRMDEESWRESLVPSFSARALALFLDGASNEARAIALLTAFDRMSEEQRKKALETLILVGLDMSRKMKNWKKT
jgi:hypothetical protein